MKSVNGNRVTYSLIGCLGFLMSGCMTAESARTASTLDLCRTAITSDRVFGASDINVANGELSRRGERCDQYMTFIQNEQMINIQRSAVLGAMGMQLLNQSQPRVLTAPSNNYSAPQPYGGTITPSAPTNCRVIPNIYGDRIQCP